MTGVLVNLSRHHRPNDSPCAMRTFYATCTKEQASAATRNPIALSRRARSRRRRLDARRRNPSKSRLIALTPAAISLSPGPPPPLDLSPLGSSRSSAAASAARSATRSATRSAAHLASRSVSRSASRSATRTRAGEALCVALWSRSGPLGVPLGATLNPGR